MPATEKVQTINDASVPNPRGRESGAPAASLCLHCSLPLSRAQISHEDPFCCGGCRAVYALIHDAGLDRYYDLRSGPTAPAPKLRPDGMTWLDPLVPALQDGEACRLTLDLQGIQCTACVWLLQELFRRHEGGIDLRVNPALGRAELAWKAGAFDLRGYLREVEDFGYRFGPPRKGAAPRSRGLMTRLGLCAFAAMNVMLFSLAFYTGMGPEDGAVYRLFGLLSFVMTLGAVLAGGSLFFESAWKAVRARLIHLDLPIALGILLSFSASTWVYFSQGPKAAFFDTVTIFVTLMVVGRWLQERVLERNRLALLEGNGLEHLFTRRFSEGKLEAVPLSEVRAGDELWVVPGDLVGVESISSSSDGEISLDWINGESTLRRVREQTVVPAGAWNGGESTLQLTARQDFAESRLHELMRSPIGREDGKDPSRRYERRFATIYVTAVLVLGALGFLVWQPHGFDRALNVATSILIVTCPCAIGLATPLAHELIHLLLRRRGVFLRDRRFLERALFVRKVLFDKTGTLTLGGLRLTAEARSSLHQLAALEREVLWNLVARSNHPVSRCLAAELASFAVSTLPAFSMVERAGDGLEHQGDGQTYRLGRSDFALTDRRAEEVDRSRVHDSKPGESWTYFTRDGRLLAAFSLEEELKLDARPELDALRASGYAIHLLSGDRASRVAQVAETLGIDPSHAFGELSPEEKAAQVRRLDAQDTLMVGDGLNDSPSFAAAYCTATPAIDRPALPARADFYFLGDGIAAVRRSLEAAHRLRAVLRGNLVLALSYNAAALSLCFLGLVGPVLAAILMPASSIAVVATTVWRLSERRATWMS